MMHLSDIPDDQWAGFLDQFSRLHHGQEAQIELTTPRGQICPQASGLPFLGVTEEHLGRRRQIAISAGDPQGRIFGHAVAEPTRVQASEWNDGVSALLQIESADGGITSVQIGPVEQTLPPGVVTDGLYERQ